jgi:hypothetical protein
MVKRARMPGDHTLVDMNLAKDPGDSERLTTIHENHGDFLFVGRRGNPDFTKEPVAGSIVDFTEKGRLVQETYLSRPGGKAKAEKFVTAHSGLVVPLQTFLDQANHPGTRSARLEKNTLHWMLLMADEEVMAGHLLYPDIESTEEDRRVASGLFVARALTTDRDEVIGSVNVGRDWDELAFDLTELVSQEQAGTKTELRRDMSIQARALGAVGHLVGIETLQAHVEVYEEPVETTVIEAGTMLHEE